jgi:tetratricopeptide (TPR) repeat protein
MMLTGSDDVACMPEPLRDTTADADELAADLLVVIDGPQNSAAAIIATCEAELARAPSPDRAARLHHEIARTHEAVLGDLPAAFRHYQAALEQVPDRLASIRGARRALLELRRFAEALPFWDAELRVVADPKERAALQYQKGRYLSEALGDEAGARSAYAEALELDPANPTILKALERCHLAAQEHRPLLQVYERAADAVTDNARLRAALMVRRAQILANHLDDAATAAEIYLGALQIDPEATGAREALEAIATSRQDWNVVIALLGQTAARSKEAVDQALAFYRSARVHAERLGNRREAAAALEAAIARTPGDALVLEELVRLHGDAGESQALAAALRELIGVTTQTPDRVALLHALGRVHEGELGHEEEAIQCFREALALDATHTPLLQSLGKLLTVRQDWRGLVDMHLAEAAASGSSAQRAAAHSRAAEILERRLLRPADAAFQHAQALALVPGFPASFKALVRLYVQSGQHRELVELYERAIDETTTLEWKVTYLFNVGALWAERLGDGAQAAHAYRRILELQPDNLGALHALQRVLEKTEQYDKLVSCLEREAELTQETDLVLGLLHRAGTILDEQIGDQTAAKRRFLKALDIDPGFVPALASLGRIHYRAGQWDDLLQMYRRELDATADERARVALLVKMGELCERQMGRSKEAIAHYQEAFELVPAHRPALSALVRLLRQAGEYHELALLLEKHLAGLETPAGRALTAYRIGELYEEHLDSDIQAIEFYRKALAALPGYRPAALAVARVLERAQEWAQVVEHLTHEAEATNDVRRRASILMRQGELWRDRLQDYERAITCFEELAAEEPCSALLALEDLYARAGDWAALAGVHARQVAAFAEPVAKLTALRELARVQEVHGVGAPVERAGTYQQILLLAPDDADALRGLAEAARQLGDDAARARVFARLAGLETDAAVAAEYQLRLAQMLEAAKDPEAMTVYRVVLQKMPESLSAVRALARLAEANGDTAVLVEALRREAALTTAPEEASALLVRSASVSLQHDDGAEETRVRAAADLERALELSPDSVPAAEALGRTLQAAGRVERLADILSKAASAARDPERQAALWLAVALIHEHRPNGVGAAVAALKRALKASADCVDAHRALARIYRANAQWSEAATALEMLIRLGITPAERADTLVELAVLMDERLGSPERARTAVLSALEIVPGHPAARRQLAQQQMRAGELDPAEETARALFEGAADNAQRVWALLLLASLERKRGNPATAEEALAEAIAIEGAAGEAAAEFQRTAASGASWVRFASALDAHLKGDSALADKVTSYLALAATYGERMGLPGKAVEVLQQALAKAGGGERRLTDELLRWLRAAGQPEGAAKCIQQLLEQGEHQTELWRALAHLYRDMGRPGEARLAASALVALGGATPEELELIRAAPPRPGRAGEGPLGPEKLAALAIERAVSLPATALLASCAESLAKIFPTDLARFGLSRKDRLARGNAHPLRELIDELCDSLTVECDAYEVAGSAAMVTIALTDPVSLIVSERVRALPKAQQVFLLARALVAVSLGLHPALIMPGPELARILAAATRAVVPNFGAPHPEIDDLAHRIRKAQSRRWRKAHEVAAAEYAAAPLADAKSWQRAIARTLNRAAAVLADDLASAMAGLAVVGDTPSGSSSNGRPASPDDTGDLLRFWMSEPAQRFRAQVQGSPS